ncbi:ammonium transporter [Salinirubrum litoreum]|uniref:Ammonium transporter n=1 Tax=Salinirubrum litoreum TaxID=1126234 RepID=A0ABD5RA55_9EURY|nr:ammonium transporter [Salinirubrum litoreum]
MIGDLLLQSGADLEAIASGVNNVWILVVSFLIFFMQPGFALLEAGQVRAKNVGNVLMKNMLDWTLGVLVYFIVGAGLAGVIGILTSPGGGSLAGAFSYINTPGAWIGWLFGAVFAMTAATIVSGAVAERMDFTAYAVIAGAMTAVIYPVVQGLTWSGGLLAGSGYIGAALGTGYLDFAGATVVHMVGGIAGLVVAKMVGSRTGRFDESGNSQPIPGHSMIFAVLGTLMLAFGWYGFNVGTQATVLSVSDGSIAFMGEALGRVALVTTLGMGAGALGAMFTSVRFQGKPDPLWTANGLLAGLVAVTGAVPHVTWWGGLVIGLIGGLLVLPAYRWVVDSLQIDDVCGVFAVHGAAGGVGTILIPVFAVGGFGGLTQLIMQIIGVLVIGTWTVLATMAVTKLADVTVGLRVSAEEEAEGLDQGEHGISAYPEFGGGGEPSRPERPAVTDGGEYGGQADD